MSVASVPSWVSDAGLYCIDEAVEVVQAEKSVWVLDMLGRGLETVSPERASDLLYDAMERACIQDERVIGKGGRVGGLVSVPTSGKTAADGVALASASLREALKATDADKRKSRVAKLRRAVGFSARAIGAALDRPGFRAGYVAMLTLTYRKGDEWEPRHVADLLHRLRKWMKAEGHGSLRYVWVAELQVRGAIHYHAAIWLPHGVKLPFVDTLGWWPYGSSNVKEARRAVPYLMKYISKCRDLSGFPKGARIHGSGGLEHAMRRARRWLGLPGFVKARSDIFDQWSRAPGGGWCDPDGVVIPSEFQRVWIGDRWACMQVASYGRPFEAHGPFTWIARRPCSF